MSIISIAASMFVSHHLLGCRKRGMLDPALSHDRRFYGLLRGRLCVRSALDGDSGFTSPKRAACACDSFFLSS
jgi:hypothetical protein